MTFTPRVQARRQRVAEGWLIFGRPGDKREKHQARKLARDRHTEAHAEESVGNWAWALGLHPVAAGTSGFRPRCTEDEFEEMEREAAQALAEQAGRTKETQRWFAAQIKAGGTVTTQELAERLGAEDEAQGRALLEAWTYDLFHRRKDRQLWRALKRLEAREAGLTEQEADEQVKREERRLKRLEARPTLRPAPERLKRPRPIEYRPEVQPTAPTN